MTGWWIMFGWMAFAFVMGLHLGGRREHRDWVRMFDRVLAIVEQRLVTTEATLKGLSERIDCLMCGPPDDDSFAGEDDDFDVPNDGSEEWKLGRRKDEGEEAP